MYSPTTKQCTSRRPSPILVSALWFLPLLPTLAYGNCPTFNIACVETMPPLDESLLPPPSWASIDGLPITSREPLTQGPYAATGTTKDKPQKKGPQWLNAVSEKTNDTFSWIVGGIDNLFADDTTPPLEEKARVSGQLTFNTLWRQDKNWHGSGIKLHARAHLPNLEHNTYVFFGQDNKYELVSDQPESFTRNARLLSERNNGDQSFFAGVGMSIRRHLDFRAGFRGGLKPYVQTRYARQWPISHRQRLRLRDTVFWSARDSVGNTASVQYEFFLTHSLLFRWDNSSTITRRSHGFDWYSSIGVYKTFGRYHELSFEILASRDAKDKNVDVSEYGVRAGWRMPIYRDLLHLRLLGGHFWPRDNASLQREKAWAIGASFDFLF